MRHRNPWAGDVALPTENRPVEPPMKPPSSVISVYPGRRAIQQFRALGTGIQKAGQR
jgi:hypothetical protein